jgi:hypothetical protein
MTSAHKHSRFGKPPSESTHEGTDYEIGLVEPAEYGIESDAQDATDAAHRLIRHSMEDILTNAGESDAASRLDTLMQGMSPDEIATLRAYLLESGQARGAKRSPPDEELAPD